MMYLAAAPAILAQDAARSIKAEIERLQQSLEANPITDQNLSGLISDTKKTLQDAADALAAGRLYASLEKLGSAENLLLGARAAVDKAEIEKNGLSAFEARWGKASLALTALDQQAQTRDWSRASAAAQALSEAAQGRAIPLLDGGRGFATATGPADGLFYVGQAEGEAAFAKFVASLSMPRTGNALPLRTYLAELASLQQKANSAFQPPKSIDLHPRFIALNSAIKLAQELDARKFYAGALYEYLEAVRHYGMLDAKPLDEAAQAGLQGELAAAKKKLAEFSTDGSIGRLYVERVESYVQHADHSAPSADEWRAASVVLNDVLPAYYAAQKRPASTQAAFGEKTVAITLVRWPYT